MPRHGKPPGTRARGSLWTKPMRWRWQLEPVVLDLCPATGSISSVGLDKRLVDVAPTPIFALFERLDDGVGGGMEMLGGVFVGR